MSSASTPPRSRLSLVTPHAHRLRAALVGSLALATLQSMALLPLPLLVQYAFDVALPQADIPSLMATALVILGLHGLSEVGLLTSRRLGAYVAKSIVAGLRRDFMSDVLGRPRAFFDRLEAATIHDRLVHDTERVDGMLQMLLLQFMPATVLLAGLTVVLALVDVHLFLVAGVCVAPVVLVGRYAARRLTEVTRRYHARFGEFSRRVLFRLRYADLVRSDAIDAREAAVDARLIDLASTDGQAVARSGATFTALPRSTLVVAGVAILIVGGMAVAEGRMSSGQLLAFYAALAVARASMHAISVALPVMIEGWTALQRLQALADLDTPTPYTGTRRLAFSGRITLDGVSFGYGESRVLDRVSLETVPGEIVALVGQNGAGKTTLLRLILGWYRPTSGRVLAEGVPLDDVDLQSLRQAIGLVPQVPLVFAGTAAENLAFGLPLEPGSPRFVELLERSGAAEFVKDLRDGLDTRVYDDGSGLSGGERQRLVIARALMREPRLLLLDEPTNHLSPEHTSAVLARLLALPTAPAVLMVTHDARAVKHAHRVFALEDGRLRG